MSRRFQFSLRALLGSVLLIGTGCALFRLLVDQEKALIVTNEPLDIAIAEGDGFFAFADAKTQTVLYSRSGNLAVSANGQLVLGSSGSGRIMQPPLSLPTTSGLVFTGEGVVWVQGSGGYSKVGQLQLAKFANQRALSRIEENVYEETSSSGPPLFGRPGDNGFGRIFQNMLWGLE